MISSEILPIFLGDTLTLTVNQRLCLELQRWHQKNQVRDNHQYWPSLNIQPITSWVKQLWGQYATSKIVLNPWQEQCLWQQVIVADHNHIVLNPSKTAQQAKQAWQLLQQWRLPLQSQAFHDNEDIAAFINWTTQFQQRLSDHQAVTECQLIHELCSLLPNTEIPLPENILLIGFDQISPDLTCLLQALAKCSTIHRAKPNQRQVTSSSIQCNDPQHQLDTIARWAMHQAQQQQRRVGIIFPTLSQSRHQINAVFKALQPDERTWFNLSASNTLSQFGIIQTAVQALTLACETIEVEQFYECVQSPYLNLNIEEMNIAAVIDRKLREQRVTHTTLTTLFKLLPQVAISQHSSVLKRMSDFQTQYRRLPCKQSPSEWSQAWCQLLHLIGWPGGRELNSEEFQLVERFKSLLEELAQLDLVHPQLTYSQALSLLRQQLGQTHFQSEGSQAPIQILGILESSGLHFDAVWFGGLDIDSWPVAAKPNPFIPIELQRQHKLPHSSAERELEYCQQVTQRILTSADISYCSWAACSKEKHLLPSPLIKNLTLNEINNEHLMHDTMFKAKPIDLESIIEKIPDQIGPGIKTTDTIRGGSGILKAQADCPFKAFATMRLQALALNSPTAGINPLQRGNLIHRCLESIWNTIQSQEQLCDLTDNQLDQLITTQVKATLREFQRQLPSTDNTYFIDVEQQRLENLLHRWLALEKQRDPFHVIANELQQQVSIGPLQLNLKIDRIDQLHCGNTIIIDYKTGNSTMNGWFGDTLQEPQLPLYCSYNTQNHNIAAISFAEIRTQELQFKGVASETLIKPPPGITPIDKLKQTATNNWTAMLQQWRDQIATLSHDFSRGYAAVSPTSPNSCRYCDLQSFCRINQ